MASMLADVINAGTAYRARQAGFTLPAAGKTGTTNDYADAWFVGFTPKVVTGVWIGFDQPKPIIPNGYAGEVAVPLWAGFMKAATRGDKPEWFDRPQTVVGTNVCRISGKLPTGGCEHVDVINRDGFVESRSMVFTEYFVRGTQPTTECPLHRDRSFMDTLAGMFGKDSGPAPVPVETTGAPANAPAAPPSPASAAGAQPAASPAVSSDSGTPKPARKRGFWSRVFGVGGGDDRKAEEEKKKEEQKKKPGGR
jgi:penicillin-binding protein 1A